jgi:hypothetical protein
MELHKKIKEERSKLRVQSFKGSGHTIPYMIGRNAFEV